MKINKILNNNVVVCLGDDGTEKIIMGCGIAFGKKAGAEIDASKIEKQFVLQNKETNKQFQQFIQNIPMERVLLAEEIIEVAKASENVNYDDSIYVTLTDHLNNALDRAEKGIFVENPLVSAIKNFYPKEFGVALKSIEIVEVKTGIKLSLDEAGFITMHFVTAQLGQNPGALSEVISFVNDISELVKKQLKNKVDESSISWRRFITHLTFFAQRLMTENEQAEEEALGVTVKTSFPKAYELIEKVCKELKSSYDFVISENEKTYLTIHVNRLMKDMINI